MKSHHQSFSNKQPKLTPQLSLPNLNNDPFQKLSSKTKSTYLKPICHRRFISEDVLSQLPKSLNSQIPEIKTLSSPKSLNSPRLSPRSFLKLNPKCKISKLKVPCKNIIKKIQDRIEIDMKVQTENKNTNENRVLDLFKSSFKGNYLVRRTDCDDSNFLEFSFGN